MVKLVSVKMLVDTAYKGPKRAGEIIQVPEDFAKRWAKNKIAELVVEEVTEPDVVEEVTEEVTYDNMTAKELYALCKEKGLDVKAKQTKEYYIEQLA